MRQESPAELIISILLYIFIGYAIFSIFAGLFPVLIVLLLASAFIAGVLFLYRLIRQGLFQRANQKSKIDEHGSRKIKASIVEMKEFDQGPKKNDGGSS
jgi:F0F1-type ATP synthase assembly protein I